MTRLSQELARFSATGANQEQLKLVLGALTENLKTAHTQMSRRLLLILISAIAFELLSRSAVDSISLAGLDLKDVSIAKGAIPPLISYLYFSYLAWFAVVGLFQEAHDAAVEKVFPKLHQFGVDAYLKPAADIMVFGLVYSETSGWFGRLIMASTVPVIGVIFLGPPVFVFYAYVMLFQEPGALHFVTLATATLSLFFLIQGVLLLVAAMNANKERAVGDEP